MDPVVHFEMPYDDRKRAAQFYSAAFGWKMKMLGEEMGNYMTAATSATQADGTPNQPGMIGGGFYQRKPDWPAQYPSVVVAVGNVKAAMEKVSRAGGKVLGDPMDIPGIGVYVSFMDTEGNRVGMLQPLPRKKAPKKKPAVKKKSVAKKKSKRR